MEDLLLQFYESHYVLVGLQETRSKLEGYLKTDYFHVVFSPATSKGTGGTQLRIAPSWGSVQIERRHIKFLFSAPECLIAKLQVGRLALVIIVAHAPPSAQVAQCQQFWDTLPRRIPSSCHSMPWVGLFDANSRLGSLSSMSVGSHAAETETDAAAHFHEFLQTHQMFLPSTFDAWHSGSSTTWTHSGGSVARLDYVALPCAWKGATNLPSCH